MRSPLLLIAAACMLIGLNAHAWGWHDHRTYYGPGPGPVVVHPIHQGYSTYPVYHPAPSVYWRTGRWAHTWHENRFGWWWVNNGGWSFYSSPVYPYPDPVPQTTIIYEQAAPQPPPQVTYVQPVAPVVTNTAPPQLVPGDQTPPANGMYYFCESSQLYYPYARTCSERWRAVPSVPEN